MHIAHSFLLPADPDRVMRMITDPDYITDKIQRTGALDFTIDVNDSSDPILVETTRDLATNRLPDLARRVVGETLTLREQQTWESPAADGSRTGYLKVTTERAPVTLTAALTLTPQGKGTIFATEGEFRASVPLVGARLEREAEPLVGRIIAIEETASKEWLATH